MASETVNKFSQVYNHDWDKYSSNYYYNKLSKEEKELWDALDKVCIYYLEEKDTITDRLEDFAVLDNVPVSFKMTTDELNVFWKMFMLSNPQYYFVLNKYYYYYQADVYGTRWVQSVYLTCYDEFVNGEKRAAETQKVKKQINSWEDIIKEYKTEEEKVKVIHDLVCGKVTYNYDIWADHYIAPEEEQIWFSQSAYSVFCTDTTVCAGYSDAMAIMCNGFGIDAVSVTSYDHQWNKVRVNDVWYNYDTTWADSNDAVVTYEYFARSDARYQQDGASHIEESLWADYSPKANVDVVPLNWGNAPGTYPTISNTTAAPSIQITRKSDGCTVKITCDTPNAKIYYTLDGKQPGIASAKIVEYKKAFKIKKDCTVKAIAICDGYKDSKIVTQKTKAKTGTVFTSGNNKYKITGSSIVAFIGVKNSKARKITVPDTVKYGGTTYKVTRIADNALKGKTKVKEVTIGKNVKMIGKQAFYGCKNLEMITIKSAGVTKVGKNALKGISSNAKIKVPGKKLNAYKSLFKNKGQGKKVTIVKSK